MKMSHCLRKLYVAQVCGDLLGKPWYRLMSRLISSFPRAYCKCLPLLSGLWTGRIGQICEKATALMYHRVHLVEPITC